MSAIMPKKRESEHGLKPGKKAKRRVRVSQQRQLSIPKDFYLALGLTDEAVMEFTGTEIIIRPATFEEVDFSADILQDLIAQGLSGQELLQEFKKIKADIPAALQSLEQETMTQPIIQGSLDDYLDALEDDEEDE
ncbi:AbrB/MazE/SpoVT family DNA-binding domain-containing protein [Metaplanococcus flavidus]|uniref:SpoVT-AbrB domain-containing protein n=1 Tax=Metaplanococcus flavidus TaxID=569883 RepID=A0ABW3LF56_9BACL